MWTMHDDRLLALSNAITPSVFTARCFTSRPRRSSTARCSNVWLNVNRNFDKRLNNEEPITMQLDHHWRPTTENKPRLRRLLLLKQTSKTRNSHPASWDESRQPTSTNSRLSCPFHAEPIHGSVSDGADDSERLTPFGSALSAVRIRYMQAGSPHAEGRIERSDRTHQDRLRKTLRGQNTPQHRSNQLLLSRSLHRPLQQPLRHHQRFDRPSAFSRRHRA